MIPASLSGEARCCTSYTKPKCSSVTSNILKISWTRKASKMVNIFSPYCISCCIDDFILELEENLKGMGDVVECLKYEPQDSSEYKMSRSAEVTIVQIKELLNMINFVKYVP